MVKSRAKMMLRDKTKTQKKTREKKSNNEGSKVEPIWEERKIRRCLTFFQFTMIDSALTLDIWRDDQWWQ